MYSNNEDKFSIVSKISKSLKNGDEIKIFNGGEILETIFMLKMLLKLTPLFHTKKNLNNSVHDIGVGRGIKLIDIVEFIGKKEIKDQKLINQLMK